MTGLGVFLGGEGPNELGSYAGHVAYHDERQPGVIVTLLRKVQPTGWHVVGALKWAEIRKYRAHGPPPNEARNVRALRLRAKDAGAAVVAFTRDSDGDEARIRDIDRAIAEHEADKDVPQMIGEMAIPLLEAWLLALGGEVGTEQLTKERASNRCEQKLGLRKNTEKVVEYVQGCDLSRVAGDAVRLRRWLERAKAVLGQTSADE